MTVNAAQGERLARVRPANTSDTLAFTASLPTEVTRLLIANNTAGAIAFRLYHVTGAGAFGIDNAVWYDKSVAANDTFIDQATNDNAGIQLAAGDTIGVRTATANALVFHIYGVTASIAPQGR